jgi:2-polyprenyl-3-methyl-5-hydroxy-6-metoxy-1,4-benzoquinol methylase
MNKIKKWQKHTGPILDSVKGFDVIECETCGFKHIVPIPTLEDLKEQYSEKFYSEKPNYIKNRLKDSDWWNFLYNKIYDSLETNIAGKGSILSIGCGPGFFLQAGKKRGWDALGIEPGRPAVEYARSMGINVIEGFFEEVDVSGYGLFDVIHAAEMIEHLPSPLALINYAYHNLKDDGIICIVAANEYNKLQKAIRKKLDVSPWWVVPNEHINYFNIESAASLLAKAGFKIIHKEVTFPIELFLFMGQNYIKNSELGRKCHTMRKQMEIDLSETGLGDFLEKLYGFFMEEGVGREFIILGRKS